MSDSKSLPEALGSTSSFLLRAYPSGLPDDDYLPLVVLLYEHMSHRNLATVLAHVFGRDYDGVLNDIGKAVSIGHTRADSIARVRKKLVESGYDDWAKQS